MYDSIPTILRPDELLDKALGRAHRIQKEDREVFWRVKKTILARIESTTDVLGDTLDGYIRAFPNLDRVTTYERELIDVVVGVLPLKRALGRVQGASETLRTLGADALANGRRARESGPVKDAHRRFVGRASSVVDDLARPLAFLAHAREVFRWIPDITPEDPTIVLAGYPNVGKSSLLARLTRARPEIAPYPYTTKRINIGHFHWPEGAAHRARRYQVVDTPGLLEKPPKDRNAIEQQAALALAFLADLIVFVLDPSEACGYTVAQQERLLASVRREFAGVTVLVVETKADLRRRPDAPLAVSATAGTGLPELRRRIVESLPVDEYETLLAEDPDASGPV